MCGRRRNRRCGWRSASSTTSSGAAPRRAPARSPRTSRGKSGGSPTTRSTARCASATGAQSWVDWPEPLRSATRPRSTRRGASSSRKILFHQYVQWLADEQWQAAREAMGEVRLFGDFPFMVAADSADVWARQHLFRFDATVGTAPDAFSETGQDWGLPVYRWDVMEGEDFRWLRQRARRMARLYDGYRVDHLVGFFRTYSRRIGEHDRRIRSCRRGRRRSRSANRCSGCFKRMARRSPPRTSARSPTSFARPLLADGRARLQGAALGTGVEGGRASRSSIRRRIRPRRS